MSIWGKLKSKKEYLSLSVSQTKNLAKFIAREVLKKKETKRAFLIGLEGDLGGGKTTFLQGFAKGLGIREKILSPTFIVLKKFQIPNPKSNPASAGQNSKYRFKYFYHLDCYRLEKPEEILALGFEEIISNPKNIVAIEWSDKIKKICPRFDIMIKFEFKGKEKRKITVSFT